MRRERAEAFADELSRRGLAGEVVTLADGGATGVGRLDETMRDYAGKKLGLIAVNGLVFLRLTEALAQLGPSLPAGLRIATFDDYPWNHVLFGGVTTAAQDTLTIAERVVERLSERIDVVTTTVGAAAKLAPKRIEVLGANGKVLEAAENVDKPQTHKADVTLFYGAEYVIDVLLVHVAPLSFGRVSTGLYRRYYRRKMFPQG